MEKDGGDSKQDQLYATLTPTLGHVHITLPLPPIRPPTLPLIVLHVQVSTTPVLSFPDRR